MVSIPYIIRGGIEGRERQRLLARIMRPSTLALFERVGVKPGMICLDAGCGGGDVSFDLARIVGPQGRVVGVDTDAVKIDLARQEAEKLPCPQVEFLLADLTREPPLGSFDLVYARFLLTHARDSLGLLGNLLRYLRPCGIIVLEDIDCSGHFCHPSAPALWRYVDLYTRAVQARGGDPNIGPRLPGMLQACGCTNIQIHVVQPAGITGEVKFIHPVTLENIADSVLSAGLASQTELVQLHSELCRLASDTQTTMSLPRVVQTWGSVSGMPSQAPH